MGKDIIVSSAPVGPPNSYLNDDDDDDDEADFDGGDGAGSFIIFIM